MKKPPPTPAVQDQVIPPCGSKTRRAAKSAPFVTRLAPTLLGKRRAINYVPGEKPRKEPAVLPRLFIRSFVGGSIKLDLDGVGIGFSEAAFAHSVADDSLLPLHVCRGDIALVEPAVRRIHAGNLLLLEIDGRPVIRRLRKQKRLWMLNLVDGSSDDLVLPANQGIQGVVIGFLRLFNELRPVRYEGTDANYSMGFEVPARPRKGREQTAFLANLRSRARPARGWVDGKHLFSVNEIGEEKPSPHHGGRPKKSKGLRPQATTLLSPCTTSQDVDGASKRRSQRKHAGARQQGKVPPAASPGDFPKEPESGWKKIYRLLEKNERLILKMLGDDQAARSAKYKPPKASRTGSMARTDRPPDLAVSEQQQHGQEPVDRVLPDPPTTATHRQAKLACTANDDDKSTHVAACRSVPSRTKARRASSSNVAGSRGGRGHAKTHKKGQASEPS